MPLVLLLYKFNNNIKSYDNHNRIFLHNPVFLTKMFSKFFSHKLQKYSALKNISKFFVKKTSKNLHN
ncbi:MAG: hypothetical protein EA393_09065 [Bacteroidetes bacterium]|nr:MAG: hypothetical protein EA393_09065 [Bacteroidota bacterium]